ncbi:MAG: GreA/GreB family elongation factor [Firmicutes bacterium]|nr:GreA/GreB family elongation factor [Bacillota bacterium]
MENEREMQFYLFRKYLVEKGYKEFTASGLDSTVGQYITAVGMVFEEEKMSIEEFNRRINEICCLYDIGGAKESIGERGHRTVINALKRYREFIDPAYCAPAKVIKKDKIIPKTNEKKNEKTINLMMVNEKSLVTTRILKTNEISTYKLVKNKQNAENEVSMDSPIAKSLLGHREGDIVTIDSLLPYQVEIVKVDNSENVKGIKSVNDFKVYKPFVNGRFFKTQP